MKIKYDGLNLNFDVQVFIRAGILPRIRPIKINFICIGYAKNKYFKIFPNRIIPIIIPNPIGKRYLKFSFIFLKKFKTQFNSFSYMPKMTHKTPLLIPGKIAPAPIKMP